MNVPSAKRISKVMRVPMANARLAWKLMKGRISPESIEHFPRTYKWAMQCYNYPKHSEMVMEALNEVLEGFGVGVVGDFNDYPPKIEFEYINTGETYAPTIVKIKGKYILTSCGDMIEKLGL